MILFRAVKLTPLPVLLFFLFPSFLSASGVYDPASEQRSAEKIRVVSVDSFSDASMYSGGDREFTETRAFSPGYIPRALIIHADPESDNLTSAIRDRMAELLLSQGWEVEVRNLYQDGFNPVATADEVSFHKPAPGSIDPQVAEYQALVKQADVLVMVYPLWWKQPPAIIKGWQDRVFSYGFAYEFVNNSPDSIISLLAGRKVLIINVAAGSQEIFEDQGYLHFLNIADASLYGASGMEFVDRHIIYSSTGMGAAEEKACLEELTDLPALINPSR